jgi:hypothetical protein
MRESLIKSCAERVIEEGGEMGTTGLDFRHDESEDKSDD